MGDVVPMRRRSDTAPATAPRRDPLWRELLGGILRDVRTERGETQRDIADRAGISMQYLSEIERGRKEPSSEMLAAVSGALGLTLLDLTSAATRRLVSESSRPRGPVALAA
ncbi:MAG: helix-turn-helix transcriptional regulator [Microlunatus sp.]